jgi:hypothetical protein
MLELICDYLMEEITRFIEIKYYFRIWSDVFLWNKF